MRLRPLHPANSGATKVSGFTLAEVLAALAFMAIVIPVAIEGVHVANQAGQVGLRKAAAARVGDAVLNEWVTMGQSQTANQRGTKMEGPIEYRWSIQTQPWNQDSMRIATAQVTFNVQGREFEIDISTLIDNSTR